VDDLLPIVEAGVLLAFATSDKGVVEITQAGKAFAEADISTRKDLFREAVLGNVSLFKQIYNVLQSKSDHAMPLEFFRDILDEHYARDETQLQIETALDWGRYADIFEYDSESDRLTLHQPSIPIDSKEPQPQ